MVAQQNMKSVIPVFLSAIALACVFLNPLYCAEFVFVFLIPIFWYGMAYNFCYKQGFLWGTIFFGIIFFDVFMLIIHKGTGVIRFFAVIALLLYSAISSSIWFFLLFGHIQKNSTLHHLWLLCITFGYFIWLESSFFFIFGSWWGNYLNCLLVPLAIRPQWLFFLPIIGKYYFLFLIIAINFAVTLLLRKIYRLPIKAFLFFCIIFFMNSWYLYKEQPSPIWAPSIGAINAVTSETNYILAAEEIMKLLDDFCLKFPHCSYIITPESSFQFPLNKLKRYMTLWNARNCTLLLGAHREKKNCLFNSCYCISKQKIIDYYDKKHLLFFAEYIPSLWSKMPGISSLFLSKSSPFVANQERKGKFFELPRIGKLYPLICSDLFLQYSELKSHAVYLCIVNDSWFTNSYIPQLMWLYGKFIAIAKHSTLIYSGYHYNTIIKSSGDYISIPTVTS